MRELSLKEMEKMAADRREFVTPTHSQGLHRNHTRRASGASVGSVTGNTRAGFWSFGSILRAIWLKI